MPIDAVGDSMQSQPGFCAEPPQAALSDDCSTVKLRSSDPAQDSATSVPQLHAAAVHSPAQQTQQAVTSDSMQQQATLPRQTNAPSTHRHCRKRKQPTAEEEQQHAMPSTSTPGSGDVAEDPAASAEQDALRLGMSPHKGKQKTSQASGGPTEAPTKKKGRAARSSSGRRGKSMKSKYKAVVGCTIDVPAPIFGVDVPDLYYRGTVLKKDPAHAGSMVVQFIEDGSRYWFPLAEIERFLTDMQSKGRNAESGTIGQGSHAFAAQVLAGTLVAKKKASSSSATAGSHDMEVSSGVHQSGPNARLPSRFSKEGPAGNAEQETSSLQTLAAAADSGDI